MRRRFSSPTVRMNETVFARAAVARFVLQLQEGLIMGTRKLYQQTLMKLLIVLPSVNHSGARTGLARRTGHSSAPSSFAQPSLRLRPAGRATEDKQELRKGRRDSNVRSF